MKKVILLMVIGTMLSISLLVGVSYALWSNTHVQETENIVETGCFSTDFTEVNSISLSNSYPISDDKGMGSTPYQFTITNTCRGMGSTPYQFTITNTCSVDAKYEVNFEVLANSTLSSNYVKLAINNKKDILSNYESKTSTIEGALSSNNIASGWLKADESITYDLRLWIDEATTLEQGEGKSLSGKVVVVSVGDELNDSLISLLLEQYKEGNEVGLVKDTTNTNLYYYTGTNEEVANNFLWYGGHQWRVLEFDNSAKTITLITQQPLTAIQPASAVWESEEAYNSSYVNTWLNDYFYNSLDSSVQANIQNSTFNIGIYTDVDEFTTTKKVGLLDQTQYERAGNTDSFLDIKDAWWLGNRYSLSRVRSLNNSGDLRSNLPSISYGVRAVVKISDLTITGGDGTLTNNYQVSNKATNTSDIQVGEYINVPYKGGDNACGSDKLCTMRVVSKNANSIKVVLNGVLPTTDSASDNITTSDTIYTSVLNTFIANMDSTYITTGTFGVGMYASGNSYTVPAATTISANVGLPTVGEMFSGNDIDLSTSSTKTFVDVATIENSTASSYYWTMNRYNSSSVRGVYFNGILNYNYPSSCYGVRAVLYLKSGTSALTFTGGEGTPQNPYTLN